MMMQCPLLSGEKEGIKKWNYTRRTPKKTKKYIDIANANIVIIY